MDDDEVQLALTRAEVRALLYAAEYADQHDDEGIRSSDLEALARAEALEGAMLELREALKEE